MKILVYSQRDKSKIYDLAGHVYSQQEKTKRSLQRLFGFWGIAVLSILVPVAHFVLVPAFLIIAPFLAYKSYKEDVHLEACEISCPECGKNGTFAENSGQWPLHNNCPHCMNRVYFEAVT
jgi:hypothetical protein